MSTLEILEKSLNFNGKWSSKSLNAWTSLKIAKRSFKYSWIILEFHRWNFMATLVYKIHLSNACLTNNFTHNDYNFFFFLTGERRLDPNTNMLALLRVNPNAEWIIRPKPDWQHPSNWHSSTVHYCLQSSAFHHIKYSIHSICQDNSAFLLSSQFSQTMYSTIYSILDLKSIPGPSPYLQVFRKKLNAYFIFWYDLYFEKI